MSTFKVRLIVHVITHPERTHQQQFKKQSARVFFIERPRHLDRYHSNINSGVCVDNPVIGRFHVKGTFLVPCSLKNENVPIICFMSFSNIIDDITLTQTF